MDRNGTGAQYFPLTAGTNDVPALTQGSTTTFSLNTVPDRCPTGPLAYYLPYTLLTIAGNLVQSGTAGTALPFDRLRGMLIDSIDWINSWFGSVLSATHIKGAYLPLVEYVAGGYQFATRQRPPFPSAAGTYPFELTVALPAATSRAGNLMTMTANLALLFQTSLFKLNVASATVLTAFSTGATFTALTARLSARLLPSSELVLGTPIENIVHQQVAGGGDQVQIKGFGTDTQMQGTENQGGVLTLMPITNVVGQGGAFAMENVTQFAMPWAGQVVTKHIEPFISEQLALMPSNRPQTLPSVLSGGDSEFAAYPYNNTASDQPTTTSTLMDRKGLTAFCIRAPGSEVELTNLQTANNDQAYFLTVTGGGSGTNLTWGQYARRFRKEQRDNWLGQVAKGGTDSLAAYVLGKDKYEAALARGLRQRLPRTRFITTEDQMTYLPWQLA